MPDPIVAPTQRTKVAIIGGGIAGIWTGLKLAQAGIESIVFDYSSTDRGGVLGSSARSVGAVNTAPIDRADFRQFMDELGLGQVHPSTVDLLLRYMPDELAELQTLGEFKRIKLGIAVSAGNAAPLLRSLHKEYLARGGRILNGWVTRLIADPERCEGVQYQQGDTIGKVLASAVVIASGGYAGLFDGSVKTNNHGTMLGRYLRSGGLATNLEFVFKHGYGKPDLGALTPTEELPGAEIYDTAGNHVEWLERELFEGRGTANHLEAFKHWRNNKDTDFYIDLKYRDVNAKLQTLNAALIAKNADAIEPALRAVTQLCSPAERGELESALRRWVEAGERIDFDRFCKIKQYFSAATGEKFRVRQIAYFSMGGAAHLNCATNLANVFVTGEAMHDFGAHRVGGLPWGLYLATGRLIRDRVVELDRSGGLSGDGDFDLVHARAGFDPVLLEEVRVGLFRNQERDLNIADASKFISWLRAKRRTLVNAHRALDDAVAWTIVAEAVVQASLRRAESRGCFYRSDHPMALQQMTARFSCAYYDAEADVVTARLVRISELTDELSRDRREIEQRAVAG